jgi:hypothetical protein
MHRNHLTFCPTVLLNAEPPKLSEGKARKITMKTTSLFKAFTGPCLAGLLLTGATVSSGADSPAGEPSKEAQYVYMDGLVTIPGRYPYTNGMTLDNGIKMARGVTVEAAVTKVTLIREGEKPATLDLKAIQRGQTKDVELKPGDRVHVPKK